MAKLTPILQFTFIFIAFFGVVVGSAFVFIGFVKDFNFVSIMFGIILLFTGIGAAIRLFSEEE